MFNHSLFISSRWPTNRSISSNSSLAGEWLTPEITNSRFLQRNVVFYQRLEWKRVLSEFAAYLFIALPFVGDEVHPTSKSYLYLKASTAPVLTLLSSLLNYTTSSSDTTLQRTTAGCLLLPKRCVKFVEQSNITRKSFEAIKPLQNHPQWRYLNRWLFFIFANMPFPR